jgi:cell division septal protein FtsQ
MFRRKRASNLFAGLIQAFVLGGAAVALWAMPQWTWEGDLKVIGARRLMAAPLAEAIADRKGMPLYRIDPRTIREDVLKNPAIADAKVRRWLFPARLEVTLREREPLARLKDGQVVDFEGVLFRIPEGARGVKLELDAPLTGGRLEGPPLQALRELALYGEGLEGTLDMTRPGNWTGKLNGIEIRFGEGRAIAEKLHVFRHLLPLALAGSAAVEYVDLRSPESPVVKGSDSTL